MGGERQFVVLSGELGIGKTTVVDLFLASLAPGTRIGRGQCVEHYGEGEPYLPLLEALGRLGHGPGGDRVVGAAALCAAVAGAAVGAGAGDRIGARAAPGGGGDGRADAAGIGRSAGSAHDRNAPGLGARRSALE